MPTSVFTIPAHRAFADSLAAGLIARHGRDPRGLARGLVLVPNQRAGRAIQDAFVRRSGGGLLLPRLVAIGDPELGERIGGALESLDAEAPVPPAIEPLERLMRLAALVQHSHGADAAEALRLAEDLGRTLDQLLVEEVEPARLADFAAGSDLSLHWQSSLDQLRLIIAEWPAWLQERGRIDLADRRNRLLDQVAARWRAVPPAGFVCAAGISTAAPAIARLLRAVAGLDRGMVVLAGLDLAMEEEAWRALGPGEEQGGRRLRAAETHPQFHLKLLLERMGIARAEVGTWAGRGGGGAAVRGRALAQAMALPAFTDRWAQLPARERRLTGLRMIETADPAEEAQVVAIALREAIETRGTTAALVTPDRALARRVSAHLRRWDIEADDSAGRPLSQTPPGILILAAAAAAAERFAPVPLLALVKQPLVMAGERRLAWLDGVRWLDLALRGPRPPAGLDGLEAQLKPKGDRDDAVRAEALKWLRAALPLLRPLEQAFRDATGLSALMAALREAVSALAGDQAWSGTAGRAAADLIARFEEAALQGPRRIDAAELPVLIERLMAGVAVRPPYGQHPRIFIWGLLEARLQQTDLMILSGLNEGVWPAPASPDPWLAPRLRAELGLPSLDRRIGLSAHDFVSAAGSPRVLVTRARRDARSPAVASRFWLRLEAMTGGVTRAPRLKAWARAIDKAEFHHPADRPEPRPVERPTRLSVTDVDRLKADPYAFYARHILGLSSLDPVDAEPSAAWRGSAVHLVFEQWMREDDCDPEKLKPRAEALLAGASAHPLMRALWQPRLMEAIDFIARQSKENRDAGRRPLLPEAAGECVVAGVTLKGRADRIDRMADGTLAIVDYKTGHPPTIKAIAEGYALQLGLLGLIAQSGGFGEEGAVARLEYWSLARSRNKDEFGYVSDPAKGREPIEAAELIDRSRRHFIAVAEKWLTGDAPFLAKVRPDYAPYQEYDQLMRFDEWYGRSGAKAGE